MKVPYINPVGLTVYPPGYTVGSKPQPTWLRVAAAVLALIFILVVTATTVVSVGNYCLTSDGGDTRNLPKSTTSAGPGPGTK